MRLIWSGQAACRQSYETNYSSFTVNPECLLRYIMARAVASSIAWYLAILLAGLLTCRTQSAVIYNKFVKGDKHSDKIDERCYSTTCIQHLHIDFLHSILVYGLLLVRHSLSIECKRYWNRPVAVSPIPSVGLCLSGKCIVAKRLIGSGCRLGWWVGSVERWAY